MLRVGNGTEAQAQLHIHTHTHTHTHTHSCPAMYSVLTLCVLHCSHDNTDFVEWGTQVLSATISLLCYFVIFIHDPVSNNLTRLCILLHMGVTATAAM